MLKKTLNQIHITGYKSIREATIELGNLNLLIGANGAGKSNLISLFTLLRHLTDENLQFYVAQQGGANALLHFGQSTTEAIDIGLTFGDNGYSCTLAPAVRDTFIFASEQYWFQDQTTTSERLLTELGGGDKETRLYDQSQVRPEKMPMADDVIQAIRHWRVYHFHDTSASAKVKKIGDLNDNKTLRPDASNLAAFLYRMRETEPKLYRRLVAIIRQMAPFFDDFVLRPTPQNQSKIILEWREKGADTYFTADYLSDGTLRFICLATLLLQADLPTTILIDEPELGLHPYAITLLASLLRKAATQTQVIVVTQSVTLVNQFLPENIIVVDRAGPASTFTRLGSEQLGAWLDDYGLGELWEKNVIGGRPS